MQKGGNSRTESDSGVFTGIMAPQLGRGVLDACCLTSKEDPDPIAYDRENESFDATVEGAGGALSWTL